jgi:protease I
MGSSALAQPLQLLQASPPEVQARSEAEPEGLAGDVPALTRTGARRAQFGDRARALRGIAGRARGDRGSKVKVDKTLSDARVEDYDALVLPGRVMNPDDLRTDAKAVQFVREFAGTERPAAAICHGPWTLVEAGAVKGRTFASWPSLKSNLKNAGATWVNEEVVVSGHFIGSRKPDDIPAFTKTLIGMLEEKRKRKAA